MNYAEKTVTQGEAGADREDAQRSPVRRFKVAREAVRHCHGVMGIRVLVVDLNGARCDRQSFAQSGAGIVSPAVGVDTATNTTYPDIALRCLRGGFNRSFEVIVSLPVVLSGEFMEVPHASADKVPSRDILRGPSGDPLPLFLQKLRLNRAGNLLRDLVLKLEHIFELPVVALGPQRATGLACREFHRDANLGATFPHAAG